MPVLSMKQGRLAGMGAHGLGDGGSRQDTEGPGRSWQNLSPEKPKNFRISLKGGTSFSNY